MKAQQISANRSLTAAVLCVLLLLLASGAAFARPTAQAGPYRVEISTDPAVIPVGRAQVLISITGADGKPVEGATVRSLVKMPTMNMGEREETAVPVPGKPGLYQAPASFSMAGGYEASLRIEGPAGEGAATVPLQTGQNTGGGGGFGPLDLLPWLALIALAAFVVYRMRRTGQSLDARHLANRGVIGGLLLLAVMLAVTVYAVRNWRRAGAMTPIEAQAMEMNTPAPPGVAPVELATVTRGPVVDTVRYTGQAAGYSEQEVTPRVAGWITWMPFYAGDRVKAGQLLAKLDTSQTQPLVAERQAAVGMAEQEAAVSQSEFRQMVADARRMRAEAQGKKDALQGAQSERAAARAERQSAVAELAAMQTEIADAEAMVSAARADQEYWQNEIGRMRTLKEKGAVSLEEFQKSASEAAMADAKVRQAQARLNQAKAKVKAGESALRRADAMIIAADSRARQMASEARAADAAIASAEAAANTARGKIGQAQAGIRQARASLSGATTSQGYSDIRSLLDGVVTQRLISPGTLANPGQVILRVAQIDPIRLQANVAEADLARIQVGASLTVRGQNGTAKPVTAKVTSVAPSVDPGSRTGVVEAVVSNKNARFLPGQYVVMEIDTGRSAATLRVPTRAVQRRATPEEGVLTTDTRSYVWVAEPAAGEENAFTARRVEVQVGIADGKTTEIRGGVDEGTKVIVSGYQALKDGDRVAAVGGESAAKVADAGHAKPGASAQTITVTNAGFEPASIKLKAGVPARLTFIRKTDATCATEVVFPDYDIKKALPLNQPVVVEFTPKKSGNVPFICPMDMIRGKAVVE